MAGGQQHALSDEQRQASTRPRSVSPGRSVTVAQLLVAAEDVQLALKGRKIGLAMEKNGKNGKGVHVFFQSHQLVNVYSNVC